MCGIFGWQWQRGKVPSKGKRAAVANVLAKEMDDRGGQSWGVWSRDLLLKGAGEARPNAFMFSSETSLFGHSRWATHGDNTHENTHPFYAEGIYLAHNGVIANHDELNAEFERTCVVDSQHLLLHMVEKKPFTDIEGYGTIVWVNLEDDADAIYLAKLSDSGALFVARTEYGIVWASTEYAVRQACRLAEIKIDRPFDIKTGVSYFAKNGKFFYDDNLPSYKISAGRTYTHTPGYSFDTPSDIWWPPLQRLWCNEHKTAFKACPCQGDSKTMNHVVLVPEADFKTLKTGDVFGGPGEDKVNRPQVSRATSIVLGICRAYGCLNDKQPPTDYCAAHKDSKDRVNGEAGQYVPCAATDCTVKLWSTDGQPHGAKCYTHREQDAEVVTKNTLYQWCGAKNCYETHLPDSLWCARHKGEVYSTSGTLPDFKTAEERRNPPPIAPVTAQASPATEPMTLADFTTNDMRREWAAAENSAEQFDMLVQLAEWWLETCGTVADVTNGMDGKSIIELAEEYGFDVQMAMDELSMAGDTEQGYHNEHHEAAQTKSGNVQAQKAGSKPTDGGAAGAVVEPAAKPSGAAKADSV